MVVISCQMDTNINIISQKGAVSGAPWGAPSGVTINYNVS